MKNLTIISLLFISACSSTESIESKMGRYNARTNGKTPKAKLNVSNIEFGKVGVRAPASSENNESFTAPTEEMPNKRAYFTTLLNQYYSLAPFSSSIKELNSCPNFHNVWLSASKKIDSTTFKPRFTFNELNNESVYTKNPILLLPVDSTAKSSAELYKSGMIKSESELYKNLTMAIDYKVSQIHSEIEELCEYGNSDDYFIYENFITYSKDKSEDKMENRLSIALRNNILINQALISSMEIVRKNVERSIASESTKKENDLKTILAKFNMPWAEIYFKNLENK